MKKIFYVVENRETKTNNFLSDSVYKNLEDAKECFNRLIDDKKCYKGQTLLLIKQTYLYDEEDNEFTKLLEEDFIEEVEF